MDPFRLPLVLRCLFVGVAVLAAAACSGNSSSPPANIPATIAPGAPVSPAPTPIPNSIATSIPLSLATSGPAISTPLPAPSGYASHLTVPIASAPAGTTFQFTSSATLPAVLPILQSKSRTSASFRIPQATGNLLPIYFTSIVPSASVTLAGAISVSQTFPTGILSTANTYYLAFYDSTQPTPAWQTIQGPVTTTDGRTLTFGGTITSFTLQANQLYGFAVFSLASTTATPPPAPQLIAYFPNNVGGIEEYSKTGALLGTLGIPASTFGIDDSGNIYAAVEPTSAPSAAPTPTAAPLFKKYPYGSSTASATFNLVGQNFLQLAIITGISGAGEAPIFYVTGPQAGPNNAFPQQYDVWNPGASSGSPSYSIHASVPVPNGVTAHDGNVYIYTINATGAGGISVYPPGSSTPSRTIPEQLVPLGQQQGFIPNYEAVGPDGTVYLTEYTFTQPDPFAGLYIYKPDGTETFVRTTGASGGSPGSVTGNPGVNAVDIDAAGNIYVACNNMGFDSNNGFALVNDSLNEIEVFAPGGTSVLRHISGVTSPVNVTVASDGTVFAAGFGIDPGQPVGGYLAAAGSSNAITIANHGSGTIVLYDGNRATTGRSRTDSIGSSASHGGAANLGGRIAAVRARLHI